MFYVAVLNALLVIFHLSVRSEGSDYLGTYSYSHEWVEPSRPWRGACTYSSPSRWYSMPSVIP